MKIVDPEISAVGETSVTVSFATTTDTGEAAAHDVDIVVTPADGGKRRVIRAAGETAEAAGGVHLARVDSLEPATSYDVDLLGPGGEHAQCDQLFFPNEFRTLRPPPGELLAIVATVSDLHFGEEVCGLGPNPDIGPVFRAADEDPPYWIYVNRAIVDEINGTGVDCVIVKGDITGEGRADELAIAKAIFDRFAVPWHAVRGNHDAMQRDVDAMGLLGQPGDAARTAYVPGARLVLVDTVDPGKDGGILPADRREALEAELESAATDDANVIVFGHHYTSSPQKRRKRAFGIMRDDSKDLLDLFTRFPNVGGFFAGHTHRNRMRTFPETGRMPHAEVCATKDYPGGWALYRIYEGGYTQELRRASDPRALRWAYRTKDMYFGLYRTYALGTLPDRCFSYRWSWRTGRWPDRS